MSSRRTIRAWRRAYRPLTARRLCGRAAPQVVGYPRAPAACEDARPCVPRSSSSSAGTVCPAAPPPPRSTRWRRSRPPVASTRSAWRPATRRPPAEPFRPSVPVRHLPPPAPGALRDVAPAAAPGRRAGHRARRRRPRHRLRHPAAHRAARGHPPRPGLAARAVDVHRQRRPLLRGGAAAACWTTPTWCCARRRRRSRTASAAGIDPDAPAPRALGDDHGRRRPTPTSTRCASASASPGATCCRSARSSPARTCRACIEAFARLAAARRHARRRRPRRVGRLADARGDAVGDAAPVHRLRPPSDSSALSTAGRRCSATRACGRATACRWPRPWRGGPVVTSTGTATEELVAGGAGLAVDPYDVDAIAGALASVLDDDDLADRLRAAGRERAESTTWAGTAAATIAAYEEVAGDMKVGCNLLWLVPGERRRHRGRRPWRSSREIAEDPPDDVELDALRPRLVRSRPTPTWSRRSRPHLARLTGRGQGVRVAAENSWLARQVPRRGSTSSTTWAASLPSVAGRAGHRHDPRPAALRHARELHADQARLPAPVDPRGRSGGAAGRDRAQRVRRGAGSSTGSASPASGSGSSPRGVEPPPSREVERRPGPGPLRAAARWFVFPAITYPHKNHASLLRAFAAVAAREHDVHARAHRRRGPGRAATSRDQIAGMGLSRPGPAHRADPAARPAGHRAGRRRPDVPVALRGLRPAGARGHGARHPGARRPTPAPCPRWSATPAASCRPDDPEAWADAMTRMLRGRRGAPARSSTLVARRRRRASPGADTADCILDAYRSAAKALATDEEAAP